MQEVYIILVINTNKMAFGEMSVKLLKWNVKKET